MKLAVLALAALFMFACRGGEHDGHRRAPPSSTESPSDSARHPPGARPDPEPAKAADAEPAPTTETLLGRRGPPPIGAKIEKVNLRGLRALREKNNTRARDLFQEALDGDRESATYAYNLAAAHSLLGDQASAAAMLKRALDGNYPRFAHWMERDADLAKLRESPEWADVQREKERSRQAWSKALTSPGGLILVGYHKLVEIRFGERPEHDHSRGNVYFYHLATKRFLPLASDRTNVGFLVDRDSKQLVTVNWTRMHGGFEVELASLSGVSIKVLDLTTFDRQSTEIPGKVAAISVFRHDGKLMTRYSSYASGDVEEELIEAVIDGTKLKSVKSATGPLTPILDDLSDGENPDFDPTTPFCAKRYAWPLPSVPSLKIDRFCGDAFPSPPRRWSCKQDPRCADLDENYRLCSEPTKGGVQLVVNNAKGRAWVVTEGQRVVQIDAL